MIRPSTQGDLGRAKALGAFGATLLALAIITAPLTPLIGVPASLFFWLFGIIALALAFRELSKVYSKPAIWADFAKSATLTFIIIVILFILFVFTRTLHREETSDLPPFVYIALFAIWALYVAAVYFFASATEEIAAESGVGLFKLSNLSVIAGALLSPAVIGGFIVLLGFIILALGFMRLEPRPVAPPFRRQRPPPSAPPVSEKTW